MLQCAFHHHCDHISIIIIIVFCFVLLILTRFIALPVPYTLTVLINDWFLFLWKQGGVPTVHTAVCHLFIKKRMVIIFAPLQYEQTSNPFHICYLITYLSINQSINQSKSPVYQNRYIAAVYQGDRMITPSMGMPSIDQWRFISFKSNDGKIHTSVLYQCQSIRIIPGEINERPCTTTISTPTSRTRFCDGLTDRLWFKKIE